MPSQLSPRMAILQSSGLIEILSSPEPSKDASGDEEEDIEIDILESPRLGALRTSAGEFLHEPLRAVQQ